MNAMKITVKILFVLLITSCALSLALSLYFSHLLDIQKVSLQTGTFELINKDKNFEIDKLRNKQFDLVIRCYREGNSDYSSYAKLFSGGVPFTFNIELKDEKNKIIKKDTFNQDSIAAAHGSEYFQWAVLRFNAEKDRRYKIRIIFSSDNKTYDTMKKEIYLEQHYDHPSMPFWHLFQRVFLIFFIITFIPILITSLIFCRQKSGGSRQ